MFWCRGPSERRRLPDDWQCAEDLAPGSYQIDVPAAPSSGCAAAVLSRGISFLSEDTRMAASQGIATKRSLGWRASHASCETCRHGAARRVSDSRRGPHLPQSTARCCLLMWRLARHGRKLESRRRIRGTREDIWERRF
jgi:hypothetical protein